MEEKRKKEKERKQIEKMDRRNKRGRPKDGRTKRKTHTQKPFTCSVFCKPVELSLQGHDFQFIFNYKLNH